MADALDPGALLERARELARIAGRLGEARAGDGGLLVIEGPAGIGKTSLLQAVRAQAEQAGMRVLSARGSQLEQDFAFGVLRQALERPLSELDADQRAAISAGQAAHADAMFDLAARPVSTEVLLHGLYWLLANLAEQRPLVLAIDDAHWADQSSLVALAFLARRVEQLPIALVVCTRPPDVDTRTVLAALIADPVAERLTPEALGETAIATIAGSDDPAFVRAAAQATGGNPFLLDQLLRELADDRSPEGVARLEPRALGRTVLTRISDRARALAWALVILGERATLTECGALAGVGDPADVVDELVDAGVLADDGELWFRHPLIAAAVAAGLPAARRAQWHGRAAALLRGHADVERLAMHLAACEPAAAADVVDVLSEAARRSLARGAPASAAPLLRRALAEPPNASQRPSVLLTLGEVLTATGDRQAASIFAEAAGLSDDPRVQTRALEARGWWWALEPDTVAADLAEIDSLIDALPAGGVDPRLRLESVRLAAASRSAPAMTQAVARAGRIGLLREDGPQHPDILAHVALWRMLTGHRAEECVTYALRAIAAATGAYRAIPPSLWFPFTTSVLQAAEHLDEALTSAVAMQQTAREHGSPTWYALMTQSHARLLRDRGDLPEAEAEARLAVEAADGSDGWMKALPTGTLVGILLDRGQLADATAAWDRLGLPKVMPDSRPMTDMLVARSRLRHAHGDTTGALHDLKQAAHRLARVGPASINDQFTRLHTARLEHATGATEAAREIAATAFAIAERWDTPGSIGSALYVRGLIDDDVELLSAAAELLARSPLRLEHATAMADLGATLRRRGTRRDARTPLLAALELARDCGADGLSARISDELEASGISVPAHPRSGVDALTPSERRIARTAADGATNKEIAQALFLSVKTIEMHLGSAYRKLDISSRRELASVFKTNSR